MARFTISQDMLTRAREVLGLSLPVSIWVGRYSYFDGRYIALRPEGHRIGVDGRIGARRASKTLWHELVHAKQVEEIGSREAFDQEWDRQMLAAGVTTQRLRSGRIPARRYASTRYEVEAEMLARLHHRRTGSLTEPTGRRAQLLGRLKLA